MPKVVIIDYGLANLRSVINAISCFPVDVIVAEKGEEFSDADFIILPSVGHFGARMRALRDRNFISYFREARDRINRASVGLQGMVRRFDEGNGIKVPHMGYRLFGNKG